MNQFYSDEKYQKDLDSYTQAVVQKYGVFSQTAQRETMSMADTGNTVAGKLYADMVFYKKIFCRFPYRDAFDLYLRCAGIKIDKDGSWLCSGNSYPLAFCSVGYYLVNYKRASVLKNCEKIDTIENMTISDRLAIALKLAVACIKCINAAEAINLCGRILLEISKDSTLFEKLYPVVKDEVEGHSFKASEINISHCSGISECAAAAEIFFEQAARDGYVYACNSMAAREAERIVDMKNSSIDEGIDAELSRYVEWLKISADKYEPYAANRLGLFYMTGRVKSGNGEAVFGDHVDYKLARQYFIKATAYPDANSAWAYYNLIKYFPRDYTTNLELMNEHMDYIKELNPRVYDLAMEL